MRDIHFSPTVFEHYIRRVLMKFAICAICHKFFVVRCWRILLVGRKNMFTCQNNIEGRDHKKINNTNTQTINPAFFLLHSTVRCVCLFIRICGLILGDIWQLKVIKKDTKINYSKYHNAMSLSAIAKVSFRWLCGCCFSPISKRIKFWG